MERAADRLEGRYRRLLLAYPAAYRRRRGEEIVATLLDAAEPGQTRPGAGDAADLVLNGLRRRASLDWVPGLAAGARTATPYAVGLAAAISAFLLVSFNGPPPIPPGAPAVETAWLGYGTPHFGRLAHTLLGAGVMLVAMVWLHDRLSRSATSAPTAVAPTGGLRRVTRAAESASGWAAGLSAFFWATGAYAGPLASAVFASWLLAAAGAALPAAGRRIATGLALTLTAVLPPFTALAEQAKVPPAVTGALLALGAVGLAGTFLTDADHASNSHARRAGRVVRAVSAAIGAALAVGVYDNGWTLFDWSAPAARTAILVATLALVPLSVAMAAAVRALPSQRRPLWTVVAACAVWVGAVAMPNLASWGPVLLLAAACVLVLGPVRLLRRARLGALTGSR